MNKVTFWSLSGDFLDAWMDCFFLVVFTSWRGPWLCSYCIFRLWGGLIAVLVLPVLDHFRTELVPQEMTPPPSFFLFHSCSVDWEGSQLPMPPSCPPVPIYETSGSNRKIHFQLIFFFQPISTSSFPITIVFTIRNYTEQTVFWVMTKNVWWGHDIDLWPLNSYQFILES